MKKKNLVFLHCSGGNSTNYESLLCYIANSIGANVISFNAPLVKDAANFKYFWFNKNEADPRRDAIEADFVASLSFIKEKLANLALDLDETILLGHSQGGAMASVLATQLNFKLAISIVGDLPYNIEYKKEAKTPVLWLESGKDTYLNASRKESYVQLESIGVNLKYDILPNSTHFDFEQDKEYLSALIRQQLNEVQ